MYNVVNVRTKTELCLFYGVLIKMLALIYYNKMFFLFCMSNGQQNAVQKRSRCEKHNVGQTENLSQDETTRGGKMATQFLLFEVSRLREDLTQTRNTVKPEVSFGNLFKCRARRTYHAHVTRQQIGACIIPNHAAMR